MHTTMATSICGILFSRFIHKTRLYANLFKQSKFCATFKIKLHFNTTEQKINTMKLVYKRTTKTPENEFCFTFIINNIHAK